MLTLLITVGSMTFSTGCMNGTLVLPIATQQEPTINYDIHFPFIGYTAPANLDDLRNYSVLYNGSGGPSSQIYSFFGNSGNGNLWGNFGYSNATLSLRRGDTTGPCNSGTAPDCGFTWGSGSTGVYKGYNVNVFPNLPSNNYKFSKLKSISVDIDMTLATGNLVGGGFAGCGLNLGLGVPGAQHGSGLHLPNSLAIAGRNSVGDFAMFSYHILNGGQDMARIETPINYRSGSFTGDARWDTTFDMTEGAPLIANGDNVKYRMYLDFDHDNELVDVTFTPLFSLNKDVSLMQTQKISWDYFAPQGTVVGSEPRVGIATDHGGTVPLSKQQVLDSNVALGFHENGVVKNCSFSNVIVRTHQH